MRRAAAQLLDRLGLVDFQVAAFAALTGGGRCGLQREAVLLRVNGFFCDKNDGGLLQGTSKLQYKLGEI